MNQFTWVMYLKPIEGKRTVRAPFLTESSQHVSLTLESGDRRTHFSSSEYTYRYMCKCVSAYGLLSAKTRGKKIRLGAQKMLSDKKYWQSTSRTLKVSVQCSRDPVAYAMPDGRIFKCEDVTTQSKKIAQQNTVEKVVSVFVRHRILTFRLLLYFNEMIKN